MSEPIDMTSVLVDYRGEKMRRMVLDETGRPAFSVNADGTPEYMTLGMACADALDASTGARQGKPAMEWRQKQARAILADRVRADAACVLNAKEKTIVCEAVGELYTGAVIARVVPLIDPDLGQPELK